MVTLIGMIAVCQVPVKEEVGMQFAENDSQKHVLPAMKIQIVPLTPNATNITNVNLDKAKSIQVAFVEIPIIMKAASQVVAMDLLLCATKRKSMEKVATNIVTVTSDIAIALVSADF